MEINFSRVKRAMKLRLLTGIIILGISIDMMACDKKAADGNTEVANQAEMVQAEDEQRSIPAETSLIPMDVSTTEQGLEVVPGMVGEEDEEQIWSLITDFTEDAKNKDFNTILPYFSIDNYVGGYNMELAKDNFGDQAIQPTIEDRVKDVAIRYTIFVFGFAAGKLSEEEKTDPLNAEDLKGIIDEIDLTNLTVKRIDTPMVKVLTSDSYRKIIKKRCNEHGANNITYRTVLYEIDGDTYYCGFTLHCYDGLWEVAELSCDLVPVDITTVTFPCKEKEYLELIGEE